MSDHVAGLMTKTFLGLLQHADLSGKASVAPTEEVIAGKPNDTYDDIQGRSTWQPGVAGLHYNIQIHLPATKDVEVYNAIFKSLREHLLNE